MPTPIPAPDEKAATPAPPSRARCRGLWAAAVLVVLIAAALAFVGPYLRLRFQIRAARIELERFHTPQALRQLEICRSLRPNDPEVLLMAARAERRALHYAEAGRLLEKYQQVRGLDDAGSFEQLLLSAERNVDRVADQCWSKIAKGHADTALLYEALTRGYFRQYQLRGARLCLDRWLEADPDSAQAHYLDGQFYLQFAKATMSLPSFRRALELDPEHEEAHQALAVALLDSLDSADAAEAAQHFDYVRQRQPENWSVQVGLAECYNVLGRTADAVRIVDDVLAQQPDYTPALSLRGRLAVDQGQFTEAEAWLRRALGSDPNNYVTRFKLIQCLRSNGKDEEARQEEERGDQIKDDLQRYNQIVTHDLLNKPRDAALQCELGQVLLRLGRRDEGVRWLESALRDDPKYAPAQQALAEERKKAKP